MWRLVISYLSVVLLQCVSLGLQVYLTGNNLLTFWGGDNRIDPEGNQTGYPILRSVTSGIRLSF